MSTIVLRSVKGTPLTNTEVDTNFTNLNTDKIEAGTAVALTNKTIAFSSNTFSGTLATANGGTNLSSFTSGGVVYASSGSALATGVLLTFDGTNTLKLKNTLTLDRYGDGTETLVISNNLGNAIYNATGGLNHVWQLVGSEAMRLTSTSLYTASGINVGIGTSNPFATPKLSVFNSATITTGGDGGGNGVFIAASTGSASVGQLVVAGSDTAAIDKGGAIVFAGKWDTATNDIAQWAKIAGYKENATNNNYSGYLGFYTRANGSVATEKARITSDGNFGLNVTPSAWSSDFKALQTGSTAAKYASFGQRINSTGNLFLSWNAFNDSTGTASSNGWKYTVGGDASTLYLMGSQHAWYTAPAGATAGDPITFTQAMTLDANGRLGIGTTSVGARLDISYAGGTSSNTTLGLKIGADVGDNTSRTVNTRKFATIGGANYSNSVYNIGMISCDSDSTFSNLLIGGGSSGIYDATSIKFITATTTTSVAGLERLVITDAGNIGIGISIPTTLLDLAKSSTSGADISMPNLFVRNTSATQGNGSSTFNQVVIGASAGNGTVSGGIRAAYDSAGPYGTGMQLYVNSTNPLQFFTNNAERARIDSSGNLLIGCTTGSSVKLRIQDNATQIRLQTATNTNLNLSLRYSYSDDFGNINCDESGVNQKDLWYTALNHKFGRNTSSANMILDSSGNLLVGKTASDVSVAGTQIESTGTVGIVRNGATCLIVNRLTDDGTLVSFRQDSTEEGTISVSGTTVSYNGGHLSRWAQMLTKPELFKGTVMSNLDEMNVYTKDGQPVDNEQLNKVKVSDTEGDANVAGVFVNWTHDEDHNVDEINMAMTGDMIIRIAQGVIVVRGDLLMSAGDGTAKPQGDDIIRSKTVAKVTSNHVTCTYADGSYCVPCVLMAC